MEPQQKTVPCAIGPSNFLNLPRNSFTYFVDFVLAGLRTGGQEEEAGVAAGDDGDHGVLSAIALETNMVGNRGSGP